MLNAVAGVGVGKFLLAFVGDGYRYLWRRDNGGMAICQLLVSESACSFSSAVQ